MDFGGLYSTNGRQWIVRHNATRPQEIKEKALRDARSKVSSSQSHQVLFPLAVAAIFVMTLIAGALL